MYNKFMRICSRFAKYRRPLFRPLLTKGVTVIVMTLLLITPILSGCSGHKMPPTESLFSYLENLEYARIYGLLTTKSKKAISLDAFSTRFEQIYGAISVTDLNATLVTLDPVDDVTYHAFYTLSVNSAKLGIFDLHFNATFKKEDNKWRLVWDPSLLLPTMLEGDEARLTSTPAKRGEIFDVNNELLVKNDTALSVYVDIDKVRDGESLSRIAAPLLDMTETQIKEKIAPFFDKLNKTPEDDEDTEDEDPYQTSSHMVVLKAYPKDDGINESMKEQLLELPGIGIEDTYLTPIRYYPHGPVMAHTLGYTGVMDEEEAKLPQNVTLTADTRIGKSGLEKAFEQTLRGIPGYKLSIIDGQGHVKEIVAEKPPQNGADIHLTIDFNLQLESELALMQYLTTEMSGAVVVLDPTNGKVKAIASYPGFDPNIFSFKITKEQWDLLNSADGQHPLYNRATLGLYPPGSTFKPFTASMVLESNTLSYDFIFSQPIKNDLWTPQGILWSYPPIKRFMAPPGPLNLDNAIVYSDNIYFAYAALQLGQQDFYTYCQKYGLNESIPSDIPVAEPQIANTDGISDIKLLADSGYGQGELLTTPLQMASLFASLANGGDIYQPKLIDSVYVDYGTEYAPLQTFVPTKWKSDIIDDYVLSKITPLLKKVVSRGSGKAVRIKGMDIYGKTGTAEVGNDKSREIAWFIGYTFHEDEPLLVCVMCEVPSGEGRVRFNIAKELFSKEPLESDD